MSFTFTNENVLKIEELKKQYPNSNALNLPCLWMAQYQDGYISIDAIDVIAKTIGMSSMEVYKVATFYTMFNLEPQEKLKVQVCKTLSCKLCGSEDILEYLKSKDVRIQHVECLGSCGTAPVMQINDVYYENLTNTKVDTILEELL